MKAAILAKDETNKSTLRVLLAEFSREPTKTIPDDRAIKIIRKLISSEETLTTPDQAYIAKLQTYLPQEATADDVKQWISSNIDFTQFKNKMQAMKPIMAEFAGRVDGNVVKSILQDM